MKAAEATIAWTPAGAGPSSKGHATAGQVKVCPRPPYSSVDPYGGWVYAGADGSDPDVSDVAMVFINFHTIVVRDGVDPQVAHEAFLVIDEYRERISPDIPGAA